MMSKTILIADDEQRTRQGLKKTLDSWSKGQYEILAAEDGNQSLEIFNTRKVHLLITDIRMPAMNGLQLLKTVRENGKKPVVLILSGYPDFEYAQEAIRLGVVDYLLKPINKQKLIEAVEQAMEIEMKNERAGYMEKVADKKLWQVERHDGLTPPIKEAIQYLNDHVDRPITLKNVADRVHLNASYFSALFKEQTRLTFSEYLTRKRLQLAKSLLLSSSLSIDEIAKKTGYQTAKYFIKIFKNNEGVTPGKYRKWSELE
ncbi:response regulator transcription factor [Paludifilum halophilum]|uniref:DNA-binding response regulator n=1 Tax=Paludifilum halophilum TaxID=1642702 RepID=A0A235B959_9BACL|nr:response regulator [Paludifilum halophilum]OYD08791.1 DNA-binding response regulator [Paludifilum halophilum]